MKSITNNDLVFDTFWEIWLKIGGKSRAKQKCKKKYESLSKPVQARILQALINQGRERLFMKKHNVSFIPDLKYPYTWLNGGCWDDSILSEKEIIDENKNKKISPPGNEFIWR